MTVNLKEGVYADSLRFHSDKGKGKISVKPTKPLANQNDLSLAYSPGVAGPCIAIYQNPDDVYEYTSKGNIVAVISNGTAVLGLGNLGPLASKPVMEGKAVLFKRFAGIDSFDIEMNTENIEEMVTAIKVIGCTFGGINLEDIKAPECFILEKKLQGLLDIPVFHDDQHGTAIIVAAGIMNALDITKKNLSSCKIVVSGAGAAGIACIELLKAMGASNENVILCDTKGVIYKGREEGMNPWKEAHAAHTEARTLLEAIQQADIFLGLSSKGAVTQEMVISMADKPIIFAMANPEPEILPHDVKSVRPDAIVATGRSDYPNQVNNLLGFPYIFRGALDARASVINLEMKIAAAKALAMLARESVPNEVEIAYDGQKLHYGPNYIIPVPFDPRLIYTIPPAIVKAAMDTGVARKEIKNLEEYKKQLGSLLNPTYNITSMLLDRLKKNPKRMIFAEGDEEQMIRAAVQWHRHGCGQSILIAYSETIKEKMTALGFAKDIDAINIVNSALHPNTEYFVEQLYHRLQRKGYLLRDCARLVKRDRNVFSAMMLVNNEADGMVTGLTRSYLQSFDDILQVIDTQDGKILFGLTLVTTNDRTIFLADTAINELPTAEETAQIAIQCATEVRRMGHEPCIAFVSFSNFGNPMREKAQRMRDAVAYLDKMKVDFEYDGEMEANVALNMDMRKLYPFCKLSKPANVLIMPGLHSANILSNLSQELSGYSAIGPILCGLKKQIQIVPNFASDSTILNLAAIAASHN